MENLRKSIRDNLRIREKISIKEEDVDYQLAKQYIPFFQLIDAVKTSVVVVFDLYKNSMFYVSDRFFELFGFNSENFKEMDHAWYRSRFHPDDYIINEAGTELHKFIYSKTIENRKDYKLIHDFRIKNDKNKYVRLLIQDYLLELDKKGNPWLNMKLCDLSPIQDLKMPAIATCRNINTGEIIFSFEGKKINNKKISNREIQILKFIANGFRSKEIADKLFISSNTVNNHRRNLIKKLEVSNTTEAVNIAIKLGLI